MPNAKIYVNHHAAEKYPLFESDTVIPILAGNPGRDGYRIALRDTVGGICITDSEQQDIYSEFTALYYVWKNRAPSDPDSIVGFMHYRSFLDLHHGISNRYPSLESRFGYDETTLRNSFSRGINCASFDGIPLTGACGVDAIVSEPLDFRSCTNRLKPLEQSAEGSNGANRLSRTDRHFIVFGKTAGIVDPGQRTLHNPPLR